MDAEDIKYMYVSWGWSNGIDFRKVEVIADTDYASFDIVYGNITVQVLAGKYGFYHTIYVNDIELSEDETKNLSKNKLMFVNATKEIMPNIEEQAKNEITENKEVEEYGCVWGLLAIFGFAIMLLVLIL